MSAATMYMTLLSQRSGVSISVVSDPTVNVAPVIGATPDVTPAVWSSGASDTVRWEMADTDAGPWSTVSDMLTIDAAYTDQTFGKVLRFVEAQGAVEAASAATAAVGLPTANLLAWWYGGDGGGQPDEISITGGAVTALADKSANGYDLTKAGAGTLTYEEAVSGVGRGAIVFPGTAYLVRTIAQAILANQTPFTLYIVFSTTDTTVGTTPYCEAKNGSSTQLFRPTVNPSAAGRMGFQHRDDASVMAAGTSTNISANNGAVHVLTWRRITANQYDLRMDGVSVTTAVTAPGTTTVDRIALGAFIRTTVDSYFTGKLFTVACYGADNYADIEPLLGVHYGVTMPPFNAERFSYASSIDGI
jgi:hypothetical protein